MVRDRAVIRLRVFLAGTALVLALAGPVCGQGADRPSTGRQFAASRFSIDEVLSRPYDASVPMGCTGDRLWASSPQGWAFRDDVQWLYLTNLKAFDLELRDEHGLLEPAKATYFPSHIHYDGAVREEMKALGLVHLRPGSRRESALRTVSAGKALDLLVQRKSQ